MNGINKDAALKSRLNPTARVFSLPDSRNTELSKENGRTDTDVISQPSSTGNHKGDKPSKMRNVPSKKNKGKGKALEKPGAGRVSMPRNSSKLRESSNSEVSGPVQ